MEVDQEGRADGRACSRKREREGIGQLHQNYRGRDSLEQLDGRHTFFELIRRTLL